MRPVTLRLAELRRAAGLSQEQLGFRVGVRQTTIHSRPGRPVAASSGMAE
jgi:DNA-binding XRE family transcriptional regulator